MVVGEYCLGARYTTELLRQPTERRRQGHMEMAQSTMKPIVKRVTCDANKVKPISRADW